MQNDEPKKTKLARNFKLLVAALALAVLAVVGGVLSQRVIKQEKESTHCAITITDSDAPRPDVVGYEPAKVCVELEHAKTQQEQTVGLSKYDSYDDTKGMLFIYDTSHKACIWMRDMKFPIDIVWLDENKTIVQIEVDVDPNTYPKNFCSEKPAQYVIELNRFVSEYAHLKVGQQLQF